MKSGFDGKRELGTRQVPDPYDGEHLTVAVNTRESTLAHLLARGFIDEAQKAAGDRFRQLYERSQLGGARAIDYRRPKVDGGKPYDPMASSSTEAAQSLAWVRSTVGEVDYLLLVRIAGEGHSIRDGLPLFAGMTKKSQLYYGRRFRDALGELAIRWGFI